MARWVRHGVGIGIIAAGFCAASQFRVPPPADRVPTGKQETPPAHVRSTDITLQLAPSPLSPAAAPQSAEQSPDSMAADPHIGARSSLSGLEPPPRLTVDYQSLEPSVPAPPTSFHDMTVRKEDTQWRTHVIQEGDSPAGIAKRYLGDPDRWQELFEANADVLTSPDLLPLNTVIKIPTRRLAESRASGGAAETESDNDLVPVQNR